MEKQEIHPKVLEQFMLQQVVDKKYITKNEETRNQMKLMQEKTNDYIENRIIKK